MSAMANGGEKKPNKPNRPADGKLSVSTVALAIGILLVVFGIWQLTEKLLGTWYSDIWLVVSMVISILWPVVLIVGGVVLILVARKGNLSLPTNRRLYRSIRNKKIGGVCGGIAEYLGVDPAVVRVITIVLAVLCWYVIVPLYLLSWVIIEPDTKNYNKWV
ncbi:MAG: PspC domain-containing protein [Coriobacteriales bacterium]|jgi:phage shock protein PspC (stress-responsive transcriptional regulator)|nr:PspC domain-containing protein [Coriobacteriales bacterium]